MRSKLTLFLVCIFAFTSVLYSQNKSSSYTITAKVLHDHVAFLSADRLEGRLSGSRGEEEATSYVAHLFEDLGLQPAGDDGTFFQTFDFTSGSTLGSNNSLSFSIKGSKKTLVIDQDWRPLSFSENNVFDKAELIFAGYGIIAPALGDLSAYDSYQGLNVKNKWVVVFRYLPEKVSAAKRHQLSQYASLRYKAFIAKEKGAKGIIFVSGPHSKVKNKLVPLSGDTSFSHSGIFAISVKDAIANEWIERSTHHSLSLQSLQYKMDLGQNKTVDLAGIQLTGSIAIQHKKQQGHNVLAKLKVNETGSSMIVVGAHVDHLGHGELSGSRSREAKKRIHPGADDNASGVASVLEIAAQLSDLKAHGKLHGKKDILFAIWSGEELGLLGSTYFVKHAMKETEKMRLKPGIDAYINLDMVGRLRKNLVLQGVGSSPDWPRLIKKIDQKTLPLISQNDPYLPTDSTAFYLQGVPTLNFFTGSHDEYHTPRDTIDLLNFQGMKHISIFLFDLILALEKEESEIHYQSVPKTESDTRRGFRVYLGTIPDYASESLKGVKLSGVSNHSPADRAGLKANDVIIEVAGKKVHGIYDYTFVLSALSPGQPVSMVVLRDETKVQLTIVPESRE